MKHVLPFALVLTIALPVLVVGPSSAVPVSLPDSKPSTATHGRYPPGSHKPGADVIVWTNRSSEGSGHLVIARADGTDRRDLTPPTPDTADYDAQISPDGRWIAYERDTAESSTIRLIRPDGTGDHALPVACVDPCVANVSPTWLTSGRLAVSLVFGPFDEGDGSASSAVLWTVRSDGTGLRRLSQPGIDGTFEDYYARPAPDHRYVTFVRLRNSDLARALYRMRPDGTHLQRLTPWDIGVDGYDLSTARRGATRSLIVFESYGRGAGEDTFADLATVPATCPSVRACTRQIDWLTDNGASGRRNANPKWSPDNRALVFTDRPSFDDQNVDVWTMRFDGHARHRVSSSPDFDYRPDWGITR
jgi:Tol biopolymer transport system component